MENENSSRNERKTTKKLSEKWAYTIGLIAVFGSEFTLRDILLPENPDDIYIGTAIAVEWLILLALVAFWIPKIEDGKLENIGFEKFRWRHFWVGILAYFLVLVASSISGPILESFGLKPIRSLQPMVKQYSFLVLFGLFLTGAFLEEIFYRGYLIERLTALTEQKWLAAFISWLLFTFVHLKFFGLGPTIDVSILSAAFVLLYLKERNIWPCIVVHGINGALSYLIFPLLIS